MSLMYYLIHFPLRNSSKRRLTDSVKEDYTCKYAQRKKSNSLFTHFWVSFSILNKTSFVSNSRFCHVILWIIMIVCFIGTNIERAFMHCYAALIKSTAEEIC